jgi:glycosyltransferase involved in cell wall biosynthesis
VSAAPCPLSSEERYKLSTQPVVKTEQKPLQGKKAGLVVLSAYPFDARPRRTADALVRQGMNVDYICATDGRAPRHEKINGLDVFRVPIEHQRGGKLAYAWQYSAFTVASAAILAARSRQRRYDLIYINNMPDVLVVSALLPKMLGAKVILDLHDPMPELMAAIFAKNPNCKSIRLMQWLEKWSMALAHQIVTPNRACRRIFAERSCPEEKILVVMNSPDESIFPFRPVRPDPNRNAGQPFVVMYHGTLVERNGLDVAVKAFADVRAKIAKAQFHIYGRATPFLERVMQSARERGLDKNVLHLGEKPLEEIVGAIDACDVGIIPNRCNAFTNINTPVRIFEYLARGKPVIAPRTPGIQDYFDEGSLVFFEAGNAGELARKIEFVASHPEEALSIVERGQQIYKTHSWEQEGHTLACMVEKLLVA